MVLYEGIPPCRCGGIGRRTGLKIPRRKSYGFDPRHRYHVRRSKHRSVSALRRKLHYVSSFFLTNSSLWETGSDYLLCPLSAQPKPDAAVRARECRKVFFRTMQRCFFRTTALLEIQGGQTQLVPARLYGFLAFAYGLVRMALTSVIFSPSVNVTALPSWVSR